MAEPSSPATIRILHWNVWHRANPDEIVERVGEIDPDIACLVELAQDSSYFPGIHVGERISDELNFASGHYEPVHHLKAKSGSGWVKDGTGIFSKFPLINVEVATLSERGWDAKYRGQDYRRIYLGAIAALGSSGILEVGSTHLSLPQAALGHKGIRRGEVVVLSGLISAKKRRFVLMGDFNAGVKAQSVKAMSERLVRVDGDLDQPTWSRRVPILGKASLKPSRRLDYIFVTPDIDVVRAQVLPPEPSDHHPLVIEINLSTID